MFRTGANSDPRSGRSSETPTNVRRGADPGTRNTLQLRGGARIVRDKELRESMAVDGKVPELAIVVDLKTGYFHCAKSTIRSGLWSAEQEAANAGRDDLLLAETMVKHGDLPFTVDEMQEIILDDEAKRMY